MSNKPVRPKSFHLTSFYDNLCCKNFCWIFLLNVANVILIFLSSNNNIRTIDQKGFIFKCIYRSKLPSMEPNKKSLLVGSLKVDLKWISKSTLKKKFSKSTDHQSWTQTSIIIEGSLYEGTSLLHLKSSCDNYE